MILFLSLSNLAIIASVNLTDFIFMQQRYIFIRYYKIILFNILIVYIFFVAVLLLITIFVPC